MALRAAFGLALSEDDAGLAAELQAELDGDGVGARVELRRRVTIVERAGWRIGGKAGFRGDWTVVIQNGPAWRGVAGGMRLVAGVLVAGFEVAAEDVGDGC